MGGLAPQELDQRIRGALRELGAGAVLFVCGMRVPGEEGAALLSAWAGEGHVLGNHSFSHRDLHSPDLPVQDWLEDVLLGEQVIQGYPTFRKLFRYPLLHEGDTAEKRDHVRAFLQARGYRVGHVTIDTSDIHIDRRLRERLEAEPATPLAPYRDYYLEHLWERTCFYSELALKVENRPIPHVLLLHHNLLNALFLEDALRMFRERGWEVIGAEEAFADPIYQAAPRIEPAGQGLVWALAKESGRFEHLLRYPAEGQAYEAEPMTRRGL